jgi:hypothetical protein
MGLPLSEKLEEYVLGNIERFAGEYKSAFPKSLEQRSIDARAFDYINNLPKDHQRMRYIRHYYEKREQK